jgi:hypothetical protein
MRLVWVQKCLDSTLTIVLKLQMVHGSKTGVDTVAWITEKQINTKTSYFFSSKTPVYQYYKVTRTKMASR